MDQETREEIDELVRACKRRGLQPIDIYTNAGVDKTTWWRIRTRQQTPSVATLRRLRRVILGT